MEENYDDPDDGLETWQDRRRRVQRFGESLKRGKALSTNAQPGVGQSTAHVFVELRFANMEDAAAYFAGAGIDTPAK